jgi:hypothetical protein
MAVSNPHERNAAVKTRFGLRLFSLAALASLAAAAQNCADQREPDCTVPPAGAFSVRLDVIDNPGCPAGDVLGGMIVGARPYYIIGSDGYPDFDQPFKVALQIANMGDEAAAGEERLADPSGLRDGPLYALGRFAAPRPDGNSMCQVIDLTPAAIDRPALDAIEDVPETEDDDESQPAEPAVSLRAEWSDVRFYVSTAYPGSQFEGTLKYTTDGCAITYKATGVYASNTNSCEADPEEFEGGFDPRLCNPDADPDHGIPFGSGISPDFPVACDPATKLCLLQGSFPAFKLTEREHR